MTAHLGKLDINNAMAEAIRRTLQRLVAKGARLPLYVAAVGADGTMMFCAFHSDGSSEVLAEHDGAMDPPVNLMFSDSTGEAWRVVLSGDGKTSYH